MLGDGHRRSRGGARMRELTIELADEVDLPRSPQHARKPWTQPQPLPLDCRIPGLRVLPCATTLRDHPLETHWLMANGLSRAAREATGEDHPLRRLLRPHSFNTSAINRAALEALMPVGSLGLRVLGLSERARAGLFAEQSAAWRWQPFPQRMAAHGLAQAHPTLPPLVDGHAVWQALLGHAQASLALRWRADAQLLEGAEALAFWARFGSQLPSDGWALPARALAREPRRAARRARLPSERRARGGRRAGRVPGQHGRPARQARARQARARRAVVLRSCSRPSRSRGPSGRRSSTAGRASSRARRAGGRPSASARSPSSASARPSSRRSARTSTSATRYARAWQWPPVLVLPAARARVVSQRLQRRSRLLEEPGFGARLC